MKKRDAATGGAPVPPSRGEPAFAVGTRVRTYATPTADADQVHETGVIVDDFGEVLGPHDHYGRDWALTKRWAIALDTGSLVFRDDSELEHERNR